MGTSRKRNSSRKCVSVVFCTKFPHEMRSGDIFLSVHGHVNIVVSVGRPYYPQFHKDYRLRKITFFHENEFKELVLREDQLFCKVLDA